MDKNITAKIILDSEINGYRLTTMELSMPKFILGEVAKHRVFSLSASSSRAIPVKRQIDNLLENHFIPNYWGANQSGMSAENELAEPEKVIAKDIWENAFTSAVKYANDLMNLGVHKQLVNRLLEPFTYCKALVSSTEWDNFFKLRCSKLAQPEMEELANKMRDAYNSSKPERRTIHLPYITDKEMKQFPISKLMRISSARCARVSYLNHNNEYSIEKDLELAEKLIKNHHSVPQEHCAIHSLDKLSWRNLKGWMQFRVMLEEDRK